MAIFRNIVSKPVAHRVLYKWEGHSALSCKVVKGYWFAISLNLIS